MEVITVGLGEYSILRPFIFPTVSESPALSEFGTSVDLKSVAKVFLYKSCLVKNFLLSSLLLDKAFVLFDYY